MARANSEAFRLGHAAIGAEHLLLAIAGEDGGVAAAALTECGLDLATVRAETERRATAGTTGFAKESILSGIEEARRLNHSSIGTEHLLLGILNHNGSAATQALAALGLTLDRCREQVTRILARSGEGPRPQEG
jgi:ATP-dependent Clp protease ATP-binding subunit ClpC